MSEHYPRLRGRAVLVTGATGFLGGAVVRELTAAGVGVAALVRDRAGDLGPATSERVHVVRGRVEDGFRLYSALAIHEAAAVIHLASASATQPDRGTAAVLDAVTRYDPAVPVVVARPAAAPPVPAGPGVLGVARFGEVFGGGDRNTFRVVPATVLARLTGDPNPVAAAGPARDFVFVRDAARACVTLAESLLGRAEPGVEDVTFRTGWERADREMAAAIQAVFDGKTLPAAESAPPNPLGWEPTASLAAGLAATIDWYRDFLRSRFFGTKPAAPRRAAA